MTGESSAKTDGARFPAIDTRHCLHVSSTVTAGRSSASFLTIIRHDYEWVESESVLLSALFLLLELVP